MKKIGLFVMVFVMAFIAIPAGVVSAADEKTVIKVYNWGEYISNGEDDSLDVIAEFNARNPNITAEYTTFATNEEMYAKIASGSADYDILIPSDYMIGKLIKEDMLAKLDFANIPNYAKIDDGFKGLEFDPQNEYSVPYTWGTVGIIYNKTKVSETVDSWEMLWNEKYKGQILMFDNPRDAYGIALKKLGYSQNSTDRKEIDEATALLKEQKDVLQTYVMDEIFPKMTSGEAALAPYYAGDAITMIGDNPDLDFAVPKEGTNRFVDSMVVPATSTHKAEAELFINFMLEDDIAKANIEYIGYSTPMSSVREILEDEVKNSHISYPSDEILAKCDTFSDLDAETATYLQESWTDVKSAGDSGIAGYIILGAAVVIVAVAFFLLYKKKRANR